MGLPHHDERAQAVREVTHLRSPISPLANERGVALVVVLWIFIFLFVLAFEFSSAVREEGMAAHRYGEEAQGYYLALAGFEEGLYRLVQERSSQGEFGRIGGQTAGDQEIVDGSWHEGGLGDGFYGFRLVDEGGKINLNRVDGETLRRLLTNLGVEEPRKAILVDSILDWRDPDDLHRTNGAEKDYYLSLTPPYSPKNGPFDAVEDLLWIRGMTRELFYGGEGRTGLREIFTVDSPTDRVNARTMSAEVCGALLGLDLEKCRGFVEERKRLSEKTAADLLGLLGIAAGDAAFRQLGFTRPAVVAIEAVGGQPGSGVQRRIKGVVRVVGGPQGFDLVRWVDRDVGRTRWREG